MKLKTKKKTFSRITKHMVFSHFYGSTPVKDIILKPNKTFVK